MVSWAAYITCYMGSCASFTPPHAQTLRPPPPSPTGAMSATVITCSLQNMLPSSHCPVLWGVASYVLYMFTLVSLQKRSRVEGKVHVHVLGSGHLDLMTLHFLIYDTCTAVAISDSLVCRPHHYSTLPTQNVGPHPHPCLWTPALPITARYLSLSILQTRFTSSQPT